MTSTASMRPTWRALLAQALIGLLIAPPAWSNPSGGDVVAGTVQIHSAGHRMRVTASDGSIIEWQDFDIPAGSRVQFIQPHVDARVMNKVLSPDPTQIDGSLSANGQLYILNPYGVFFGDTAVVDVGRLVAGAGDLSNADFLAGHDRFTGLLGPVENRGRIRAGGVALLGASAANHGQILAPNGAIWLLAGDEVTVAEHGSPVVVKLDLPADPAGSAGADRYAVENTGRLDARRGAVRMAAGDLLALAVRNTGSVRAERIEVAGGEMGRVQIEGRLDASSSNHAGGTIDVRGDLVSLAGAKLDASGKTGGGTVHIGGGWQGERAPGERNARLTVVDAQTVVRADARKRGDGGEIAVWSDGNTRAQGTFSARGGAKGGDGGRIETSAKRVLDTRIDPDVSAPAGQAGRWLLDPSNIRIVETVPADIDPPDRDLSDEFLDIAAAPIALGDPAVLPVADDSEVAASAIASALARGFSVIMSTQNIGTGDTQDGNITFAAPLDFSSIETIRPDTRANLTLRAANDIRTEPGVTISDASPNANLALSIDFLAGDVTQPANPNAPEGSLTGEVNIGGDIRLAGGVALTGDRVVIAGNIAAGDAIISEDAPAPDTSGTTVLLLARRDGLQIGAEGAPVTITTGNDEVDGGSIVLQTSASDSGVRNDLTVHANIETRGGAVVALAEGGNLTHDGAIDTTTGTPDEAGLVTGGLVLLDANLLVTNDETNPDLATVDGGDITLRGAGIRAGGGGIALTAQGSVDISALLESSNQGIAIGVEDISSIVTTLDTPRTVRTTGGLDSNGGDIQVIAGGTDGVSLELGGLIDAQSAGAGTLADDGGNVQIVGPAAVEVLDATTLRGDAVEILAATSGTGDLTFGDGTAIDAREVGLGAGDNYTDPSERPAAEALSKIVYGGLEIGTATDSRLRALTLRQDAAVGGATGTALPGSARVHFRPDPVPADPEAPGTELTIAAADGALELVEGGSGARQLVAGVDTAVLTAASQVRLGTAEDAPLVLDLLGVVVSEDQTVDADFASNASGAAQLVIRTGANARPATTDADAVDGTLRIEASLGASEELILHAGSAGFGNLILGRPGSPPVSLQSDRVELRAGDGDGGALIPDPADLARVEFDPAALPSIVTADFTLRQDAAIGGPEGTAVPQVDLPTGPGASDGLQLTLRSDDSAVTLEEAARPALEDTFLTVVGAEIDASAYSQSGETPAAPLQVRALDLGRNGNFTVNDELLRSFTFSPTALAAQTTELVLRAGVVQDNARLAFSEGTIVEGDTVRLIASDGPFGNTRSAVSALRATFRRPLQEGGTAEAPGAFVLEQDATVGQNTLPGATQFGDTSGDTLPMQVAFRSTDGTVELSDPLAVPVAADPLALQVFGGVQVNFTTTGEFSFSRGDVTPVTELRADEINFNASNNADDARFLLADAEITFAGHDTTVDGADAGDFLPFARTPGGDPEAPAEIGPGLVVIDQDATIDATTLPQANFVGDTPVAYELTSQNGSIELSDPSRVQGTALVLRLPGVSDTDPIDPATARGIVLGGSGPYEVASLDIAHNRALLLAGTDGAGIDVIAEEIVDLAAATSGQPGEDLSFAAGSSITASDLILQAGQNEFNPLADPSIVLDGVVALNGLVIDLTSNPDALLSITQDGSLGKQNGADPDDPAFDYELVTDLEGIGAGTLSLRSRRGNLGVEVADIQGARNVTLAAGGFGPDQSALLTVRAESGDLALDDPAVFPHLESLAIAGDVIRLAADGSDARVLADSDKLTIFGASFPTPNSLTLEQTAAFSSDQLVRAERFNGEGLLGLPYTLRSPGHGFVVDAEMANRIAVFDVTLDSGVEEGPAGTTIVLDASLDGAPIFAGLEAIADDIRIESSRFDTLGAQVFRGNTLLASAGTDPGALVSEVSLSSLTDVLFLGTLEAEGDGTHSLTIVGGRDIQFAGDIGATNRLHDLEVDFASTAAAVEFGSAEAVDTTVRLSGDLRMRSIDPTAFRADGTITPIPRAPATGTFRDPFDSNAALFNAALPAGSTREEVAQFARELAEDEVLRTNEAFRVTAQPYAASIGKQSDNTLRVEVAGDVEVGQGEKWTTVGTLDLIAGGAITVGDLTGQVLRLQGDRLEILRRPQSNLIDNQLRTQADTGVDWIANEFDLTFTNGYSVGGSGRQPVVGTPDGAPITATIGGEVTALPFPSAAIYPNQRNLEASDLIVNRGDVINAELASEFANDGLDPPSFSGPSLILDSRPRGPAAADFSRVLTAPVPRPHTRAPLDTAPVDPNGFLDIGIVARTPTPSEIEGREHAAMILDDASHAWPVDPTIARVASPRLEERAAGLATALFDDIFGPDFEYVPEIRETLAGAVDDYRLHTGARRVLGFELRRFLRNRPSTQFAAHQLIDRLDRLFSQHRASGLVPGEFVPVQQGWIELITPAGIEPDELAQAIHPSRYVRGSDVLDVFGE